MPGSRTPRGLGGPPSEAGVRGKCARTRSCPPTPGRGARARPLAVPPAPRPLPPAAHSPGLPVPEPETRTGPASPPASRRGRPEPSHQPAGSRAGTEAVQAPPPGLGRPIHTCGPRGNGLRPRPQAAGGQSTPVAPEAMDGGPPARTKKGCRWGGHHVIQSGNQRSGAERGRRAGGSHGPCPSRAISAPPPFTARQLGTGALPAGGPAWTGGCRLLRE